MPLSTLPRRKTAPVSTKAMLIPALVSTIAKEKMKKVSTKLDWYTSSSRDRQKFSVLIGEKRNFFLY